MQSHHDFNENVSFCVFNFSAFNISFARADICRIIWRNLTHHRVTVSAGAKILTRLRELGRGGERVGFRVRCDYMMNFITSAIEIKWNKPKSI